MIKIRHKCCKLIQDLDKIKWGFVRRLQVCFSSFFAFPKKKIRNGITITAKANTFSSNREKSLEKYKSFAVLF